MEADQAQLGRLRARIGESKTAFDAWAGDMHSSMEQSKAAHSQRVVADKENLDALRGLHAEALKRGKQSSKQAAEQQADVDELQQQIATILASEAALSKNHVEIQQEMEALRQEKAALLEELDALKSVSAQRHDQMEQSLEYYKKRLGWKLRTREHDVLSMIFTRIDPANPNREFSFNLRVCLDNTYAVESVNPPVSGYEGDLTLLNQSNNLARFIQSMRHRFQELC